ncbi:unnamed protein product, partial [Staurois parvus]
SVAISASSSVPIRCCLSVPISVAYQCPSSLISDTVKEKNYSLNFYNN